MLLRPGRVNHATMRHLVIEAARTDHKHTQDLQYLWGGKAREDISALMALGGKETRDPDCLTSS
jgi:hypothetical protein